MTAIFGPFQTPYPHECKITSFFATNSLKIVVNVTNRDCNLSPLGRGHTQCMVPLRDSLSWKVVVERTLTIFTFYLLAMKSSPAGEMSWSYLLWLIVRIYCLADLLIWNPRDTCEGAKCKDIIMQNQSSWTEEMLLIFNRLAKNSIRCYCFRVPGARNARATVRRLSTATWTLVTCRSDH